MNAPHPTTLDDSLACYGVCCPRHSRCARYAAVEGSADTPVIDNCGPEHAAFVALLPAAPTEEIAP